MITITEDPAQVIPNIMESDILNKAILIYLVGPRRNYIGFIEEDLDIHGGFLIEDGVCRWHPRGTSLLNLLCNAWKEYNAGFKITIVVISNMIELNEVINTFNIENRTIISFATGKLDRGDHT